MKPKGFRTEASGTIWSKGYRSYAAAAKALESLERRGYHGAVNQLGGKWRVRLRVDSFMDNPRRRKNPVTKKQKRAKAATSRKRSGIASAVRSLLKKTNPSAKITGARVVKLKGGGLTIRPIRPVRSNPRSAFDTQAEAERFARHIEKHAKAKVVKKGSKHVVVWTKKGHLFR